MDSAFRSLSMAYIHHQSTVLLLLSIIWIFSNISGKMVIQWSL